MLNDIKNKVILITGSAGFIGASLVYELLKKYDHNTIIGLDNINLYYDPKLKNWRLNSINSLYKENKKNNIYKFIKGDLCDKELLNNIFINYKPNIVVNLAAQAGVRYSIDNPSVYINSNIVGFFNILESCRHSHDYYNGFEHLIFASSSSVYGDNNDVPYNENDFVDKPVSLYAATKKSNELLAHSYSSLYDIPTTGLRFFTVYGPAGRPDMAYYKFTNKLIKGEKIQIYNNGHCKRDFTYIDDIIGGVISVISQGFYKRDDVLYNIYNIGNGQPVDLLEFVTVLYEELVKAQLLSNDKSVDCYTEKLPKQPGDVDVTFADTKKLEHDYNYHTSLVLNDGLGYFVDWYKNFI